MIQSGPKRVESGPGPFGGLLDAQLKLLNHTYKASARKRAIERRRARACEVTPPNHAMRLPVHRAQWSFGCCAAPVGTTHRLARRPRGSSGTRRAMRALPDRDGYLRYGFRRRL